MRKLLAILSLVGFTSLAQTNAPMTAEWVWPIDINTFGSVPIKDASTNFSFIFVGTNDLTIPVTNWPIAYIIPATALSPLSNRWSTTIYADLTKTKFYAVQVTNHLNGGVSPFSQPALFLANPAGQLSGFRRQ